VRPRFAVFFIVTDIYEEMMGRRLTPLYVIHTMRLLFYTAAMRFNN
jgi:hypothetical protein